MYIWLASCLLFSACEPTGDWKTDCEIWVSNITKWTESDKSDSNQTGNDEAIIRYLFF